MNGAAIQVSEAADTLRRYSDSIDMDPKRRDRVEERIDSVQNVSRKHRVAAAELPDLVDKLRSDFDELSHAEQRGQELEQQVQTARSEFMKKARALSRARSAASVDFSSAVTKAMQGLGMPGGSSRSR